MMFSEYYTICSYNEKTDSWKFLEQDEDWICTTDDIFNAIRFISKQQAIDFAKQIKACTIKDINFPYDKTYFEEFYKNQIIIKTLTLKELKNEIIKDI